MRAPRAAVLRLPTFRSPPRLSLFSHIEIADSDRVTLAIPLSEAIILRLKKSVASPPYNRWNNTHIPGADVACDGYRAAPAPPLSLSSLTEAGMRRCWRMPVMHGTRIPVMITGTVKFFNNDKGYGFIAPEGGGGDAFVHISAVERAGMQTLDKDQRVSYDLDTDNRGKTSAINLQAA
jgi:CspA family cold shock protein